MFKSLKGGNCKVKTSLNFSVHYKYLQLLMKVPSSPLLSFTHFTEKNRKTFSQKKPNLFIKMDSLSDDLLIKIVVRIVTHSMHDIFCFQQTNKRHAELCREVVVSRAVGNDCIALLTDLCMTHEKLDFMDRL